MYVEVHKAILWTLRQYLTQYKHGEDDEVLDSFLGVPYEVQQNMLYHGLLYSYMSIVGHGCTHTKVRVRIKRILSHSRVLRIRSQYFMKYSRICYMHTKARVRIKTILIHKRRYSTLRQYLMQYKRICYALTKAKVRMTRILGHTRILRTLRQQYLMKYQRSTL